MNFESVAQEYKKKFMEIKDFISHYFLDNAVKITFKDNFQLAHTPLYLIMEFHVVGLESEDDYGPCLSVTYQYYDSGVGISSYSPHHIYIMAELLRANGEMIEFFQSGKVAVNSNDFDSEIDSLHNTIVTFLDDQKSSLLKLLQTDYLQRLG